MVSLQVDHGLVCVILALQSFCGDSYGTGGIVMFSHAECCRCECSHGCFVFGADVSSVDFQTWIVTFYCVWC